MAVTAQKKEARQIDLRQYCVLRIEDRTKWQRAQPSGKSYRTEDGLLHCHPHPHPRYKRAGSPRGSVLGRPEEAKLTHSSHMHPPLPLG